MGRQKKVVAGLIAAVILLLTACGQSGGSGETNEGKTNEGQAATPAKEVVLSIPHFRAGQNVGGKFFLPQVERFNEKYKGTYKIEIEEVPQDTYYEKIKLLNAQGKLPALVERGDTEFIESLIARDELYDLKSWLDSKPELKNQLIPDSVAYNTTEDGKIVSMPMSVIGPIGIYYNKEMFEKAGITKPIGQMTFDEFDAALKSLKDAGFAPLALMTGENAWTTMLLASAFLANEPGGEELLRSDREDKIRDFSDPLWVKAFAKTQEWLQEYTTDNAVGGAYADAANNFLNERAAIMPNGSWMVTDFTDTTKAPEGFAEKVGVSVYPGGIGLETTARYNWWIPNNLKQEETEAALAFLEFMNSPEELEAFMIAEGGSAPGVVTSPEFESKLNPILAELNSSVTNDMKVIAQPFSYVWDTAIAENEFPRLLPLLASGDITPEEFAERLTQKAGQFK